MYVLCKEINRQRKREKRTEKKKKKSDPSKARERIHGCLTMKEIQTNCIHTIIGKRKSQMSISLIVI
jgi:hypothetical protein